MVYSILYSNLMSLHDNNLDLLMVYSILYSNLMSLDDNNLDLLMVYSNLDLLLYSNLYFVQ